VNHSRELHRQLSSQEKRALLASLMRDRAQQRADIMGPLSHGQKALWLLHQRSPGSAAYNTAFAVRVRSAVDVPALRAAFQTMIDRHASLRTTFATENGKPVAVTAAHRELCFTPIDAHGWTAEDLGRRVAEDYRQPFDLERGPLLRVSLYSLNPTDHVLLLSLHHIICDAWSMWLLMDELSVLYPAILAGQCVGQSADLPPVQVQYPDFVAWQNWLLAGPDGERLWHYWRDRLAGDLPVLGLPTDRPRPASPNPRGASHFFQIDAETVRALVGTGKAEGATLFMTLLAVFQVLLNRYTGQDDIIVGSPVAGRNGPDMATCVGYFANALPLRADLSGDPTFRKFLSQVRQTVLDALTHQDIPFPLLVERLQPKRDPSRRPVFETLFVLQRPPQSEPFTARLAGEGDGPVSWGGLDMEPFALAQMEGQFDLTWEVVEGPRFLSCVLKYDPDLFEAETIRRMEGHLKTLIAAVIDDPEQRIGRMPLLTPAETAQVMDLWQGPETAYPLERCLHHWIEDQAERTPDAVAVTLAAPGGGSLTYDTLSRRANQLARRLRRLGVGPDSVVGVQAERSLDLVVGLLGILKAGGAYLPLDPDYPSQRLAFMAADAGIAVLLTQGGPSDRLPLPSCPVLRLDADWPDIEGEESSNPMVEVTADDLAYVIYTSGSTGQPKGVENTHRGICNRLLWMQDEYRLDGSDRVLQKTPFSFDVSVWEFFWPLMTGATVVLACPGGHRDRDYLVDTIASHGITTVHFVPSMLQVFLDATGLSRCQVSLRRVLCSGEALPAALQERFFDRLDMALHNLYGPTEAAVDVTHWACRRLSGLRTVPIGRPIANTRIHLLDRNLQPVPVGVPGELHIGGVALARGYRNRPDLTAAKFIADPLQGKPGGRLYRTGDLCRRLPDGSIEYLERLDFQVKLRGFRIELGEIEAALCAHRQVREAVAGLDRPGAEARLVAWIVPQGGAGPAAGELKRFLGKRLPYYMVPDVFVPLDRLPLNPSGKVDRAALPAPATPMPAGPAAPAAPRSSVERRIGTVWSAVLHRENPGLHDNFFDLGGHSLLLGEVQTCLIEVFGKAPPMVDMFQFTTIATLAGFYAEPETVEPATPVPTAEAPRGGPADIAIIGMAGRFPGAADVDTFWRNICGGVESIAVFDAGQLAAAGVAPALLNDPHYVGAFGALAGIEEFDADFFGLTPREAELMDVQHRLLLECAWVALETAGHDPEAEERRYGLFAGVGMNRYLLNNLLPHPELIAATDPYALMLGNDKDFAPTRTAYKLNLRGPCVSVQTACSTSLVATHLACQSLLAGECDTALAGGSSVTLPQDRGYLHQEGMILSPDGHCRAFDSAARGTVGGSGVALVVLKRLSDALADGDTVYAVIKGSAINNDGSAKAGYTAPSIAGQAGVISAALAAAGVTPDTIGYVEAHGTGTPLGDPIEIAALSRVYRAATDRTGYCAIGSVKTNVGHLDSAAGVTGLIKAALAVRHGVVPPSLHFQTPNSELNLHQSPFYVPTGLQPWPDGGGPRRAGVSSFGIGGTNAHVVLEQAPELASSGPARSRQLIVLSARDPAALDAATAELAGHLRQSADLDLADVALTLAAGRRAFGHRRMLVCRTIEEVAEALGGAMSGDRRSRSAAVPTATPSVAFMFTGQGSQHVGMAAALYRDEPVFRAEVDRCAEVLKPLLGFDLRDVLYPPGDQTRSAEDRLKQTAVTQPALFTVEYALARLWMAWGVRPEALIGHSLGEYVAACVAGVWTLEDALALVALRAKLMQAQAPGGMLAVPLPEPAMRDLLRPGLSLAAVNGPALCVVSGPHEAVDALARDLAVRDIAGRPLQTSHAFHSAMMEPAVAPFLERLRRTACRPPAIPFVSNLTGTWIEAGQAVDPDYWALHLRQTVRFADGLDTLLREPGRCLIEIGPGNALSTSALRHPQRTAGHTVVTSLPHPQERGSDTAHLLNAAGQLWLAGVSLDWTAFYAGQQRRRVPLPTYPFQRRRYWVDPPASGATGADALAGRSNIADWFYVPSWQRTPPQTAEPEPGTDWLLFMDESGIGTALASQLARRGVRTTLARMGSRFTHRTDDEFVLDPGSRDDYRLLIEDLRRSGRLPDVVVHLRAVGGATGTDARDRYFHDLIFLAQALGEKDPERPCHVAVVSTGLHEVTGGEEPDPAKALLLGPFTVIPQEYEHLRCSSIDLDPQVLDLERQVALLLADAAGPAGDSLIAYRGGHRWTQVFVPTPLPRKPPPVKQGGVYLITGGTGGVGLALAEWLAQTVPGVKLALIARTDPAQPVGRLTALGAEVLTLQADVADRARMHGVLDRIRQRFGELNGVIHAAGIPGGGTIRTRTRESSEQEFAAKVDGCLVLDALLADTPLDFFVLCSSMVAVTGGFGQVGYCAANAFQDAFAQARAGQRAWQRIVAIGWDRWRAVGMAAALEARHSELTSEELGGGMQRAEGMDVFARILASAPVPWVVVSSRDFPALVKQSRTWQLGRIEGQLSQLTSRLTLHPRPALATDFVAPCSEVEREIAGIWQEEIGIEQVGAQDDFFKLGGDSLIAIKIVGRLRQSLQVPLDVGALYGAPTIATLAEHVASLRWAAHGADQGNVLEVAEDGEEGFL
jgi:amino acid adenylation domain-containing protein